MRLVPATRGRSAAREEPKRTLPGEAHGTVRRGSLLPDRSTLKLVTMQVISASAIHV